MTVDNRWFGDIPEGWQVKRNKEIFAEVIMPSKTGQETLLTVSHITGVTPRSEKNVNMFMADDMTGYKQCQPGDLVINTMWAWMGALGTSKYDGICSPAYGVYRPRRGVDYHAGYFDYLFRTPSAIMEMTRYSKGIVSSRLRLYPKDFYQIETCLPPFAEQKAIADYLDKQLSLLDQKITLLNRKIEKHQELKKSLINEIVCRGLNPNAPLIDSKIDGLGKIPQHWNLKRLKDLALIQNSNVDKNSHESEVKVRLCNYVDVYKNDFVDGSLDFMIATANDSEIKSFKIKKNDVLVTKDSETCTDIAVAALVTENVDNVLCGYHLAQIRANERLLLGAYLFRLFQSKGYGFRFVISAKGITRVGLGQSALADALTPVPPIAEQKAIVQYLEHKISGINLVVGKIKEQVGMLRALRKTLISDVVTGKLKVVDSVQH